MCYIHAVYNTMQPVYGVDVIIVYCILQPPAGSPQKLVDHSDPRLLKHSPMKVFKLQPESVKLYVGTYTVYMYIINVHVTILCDWICEKRYCMFIQFCIFNEA